MGEVIKFVRGKYTVLNSVFSENSWEDIIAAVQSGKVHKNWSVGDQKKMKINGAEYTIDIIGKNHDSYADGSGLAPLTLQLHECYATTYSMNYMNTNQGGWASSDMRSQYLPSILSQMPKEVQSAIREVTKTTTIGGGSSSLGTTADKLFIPSYIEIYGGSNASAEGTHYEFYSSRGYSDKIKRPLGASANANPSWWTRSPLVNDTSAFINVGSGGYKATYSAYLAIGVSFAFCF